MKASAYTIKDPDDLESNVLAAAPQRVPLGTESPDAATVHSAVLPTKTEEEAGAKSPHLINGAVQKTQFLGHDLVTGPTKARSTISDRVRATSNNMDGIVPFFEWRSESANGQGLHATLIGEDTTSVLPRASSTTVSSDRPYVDGKQSTILKSATSILGIIDEHLPGGKDFDPSTFPVNQDEYDKIEEKRHSDVLALLKTEEKNIRALNEGDRQEGAWEFLEDKNKLFLSAQQLFEYFLWDDKHDEKVVGKAWGIIYSLCSLNQGEVMA